MPNYRGVIDKNEAELNQVPNWEEWEAVYKKVLNNSLFTERLQPGDYVFKNDYLNRDRDIPMLNPSRRLLYETILLFNPQDVIEFGCGSGDNLYNLFTLGLIGPKQGIDCSKKQIDEILVRNKELKTTGFSSLLANVADPNLIKRIDSADVVFSITTLMHIPKPQHMEAMRNMFKLANKAVVMIENWSNHHFDYDIQTVAAEVWDRYFIHSRFSPEYNRSHAVVVAREPISQDKLHLFDVFDYQYLLTPCVTDPYPKAHL